LWNIDFGWTYFAYPGGSPLGPSINYWEVGGRADTKLTQWLHLAVGFAYSPNFSNTGAWSKYTAFGLGADLPSVVLPQGVAGSVTSGVGYYWFGNQSAALGGFALPAISTGTQESLSCGRSLVWICATTTRIFRRKIDLSLPEIPTRRLADKPQ
jgi:hypothetical protein